VSRSCTCVGIYLPIRISYSQQDVCFSQEERRTLARYDRTEQHPFPGDKVAVAAYQERLGSQQVLNTKSVRQMILLLNFPSLEFAFLCCFLFS
jgi:hypothetical protein